jgi:hypothetical protein
MGASAVQDEIYSYPSFENHKNIRAHLERIEKCLEQLSLRTSPLPYAGPLKTEKELNSDIIEITMAIEKLYPELSKYLEEMPAEVSVTDPDINRDSLAGYYNTLDALLRRYACYHP